MIPSPRTAAARRASARLGLLAFSLLAAFLLSFTLGRYPVPVWDAARILLSRVFPIEATWTPNMEIVMLNVRLPRILLVCLVGCSLASAGTCYQSVFQNPMAAPDILGASSGACFGAALGILLGADRTLITASAFGFSLLTVALVYLVGGRARGSRPMSLLLAGVMISSLFTAATSYVKLVADPGDQLPAITYWLMGSFSGARMGDVGFALVPMALGLVPLLLVRWRLNLLTVGEDEARTMGINTSRLRLLTILCSTLITAASVSVSGMIGWVGLVIPHLCRRLVGNDCRFLLPASMLFGAVFLLLVDNVSRNLLATEIPIGVLTAFVGAPFFLYLMTRRDVNL
ncbi:MAG: iron ABC transporter permease [Eubacteriales bacterium]|nr:iron ABC transporter permease [Eubacteriales bacterium]